ncbi:MAG: hypothetical protein V7K76_26030 [Nostoc sp.]|uniref:hypothetical protein n=1 Tax=Nostoc sp. TaxID=1180 RepID=UPI002FF94BDB
MANGQNTKTVISLLLELIGVAAPALAQNGVISSQASNIASGISGLILQELQALNQPQPTSPVPHVAAVSPAQLIEDGVHNGY